MRVRTTHIMVPQEPGLREGNQENHDEGVKYFRSRKELVKMQPQLSTFLLLTMMASSQSCFSELFLVSVTAGWEVTEGKCGASESFLR